MPYDKDCYWITRPLAASDVGELLARFESQGFLLVAPGLGHATALEWDGEIVPASRTELIERVANVHSGEAVDCSFLLWLTANVNLFCCHVRVSDGVEQHFSLTSLTGDERLRIVSAVMENALVFHDRTIAVVADGTGAAEEVHAEVLTAEQLLGAHPWELSW